MSSAIQDDKLFFTQSVVEYYNQNFDRPGIINFLPIFTENIEELIQLLRDYNGFNENDRLLFIYPFINILIEHSIKYFEFWDKQFDNEKSNRLLIEENLREKMNQYSFIYDYYKKSAKAWLSFSITKTAERLAEYPAVFPPQFPTLYMITICIMLSLCCCMNTRISLPIQL